MGIPNFHPENRCHSLRKSIPGNFVNTDFIKFPIRGRPEEHRKKESRKRPTVDRDPANMFPKSYHRCIDSSIAFRDGRRRATADSAKKAYGTTRRRPTKNFRKRTILAGPSGGTAADESQAEPSSTEPNRPSRAEAAEPSRADVG